jgi:hypothetical protein
MDSYQKLTIEMLPGDTPREKYESMRKIAKLLNDLAFPSRGSEAESADVEHFAKIAESILEGEPINVE